LVIEDARAAGGDRTHCELFVTGDAELADDKDIERRIERAGDFIGDGHAAARQRQHHHIGAVGVSGQLLRQ
jgi:hypothetical protein